MLRMNKWKLEKTKVKVVFRLQFHATHIPLSGWDKLFISFIPADTGKVTSKTTKANVRNGTCKWGDPIYETTRLLQDIKTKQYEEKLYKLVVAMGTSRSSVLGEATINLADYADASKPSVAVLPLHGSDSGPALHVTVQLLTSKTGFREFEQQRKLRERGLQTAHNTSDESSGRKMLSSEETIREQINKVNSRVKFSDKPKDPTDREEPGFDVSSNTSESLCAERHENDSVKSTASGQSPQPDKAGQPDSVRSWNSDYLTHNELDTVIEENNRLRGALESAESSILELKSEVSSLQSHANEIGREAELFTEQLAAEILSSETLVKEVTVLKSECSKLKEDLEQLKAAKVSSGEIGSRENGFDFDVYQPEIGMLNSGKIFELLRDLEESKGERDCLAKKTEQMECYYEGLVQELEENQRRMLLELQNLQHEHSGCLYSITSANEQIVILANENRDSEARGKELEKRALVAEAAVKRARLNYSIAVDQLQKDLELLSFQVFSMHEANENLIWEAFVDSSPAWSVRVDSGKQKLGGDIRSDDLKRSLQLQEGIYRKVEQEFCEIEVRNLYLEVFSTVLRETVVGSGENARLMKQKMNELEMKLRVAVDEVHSLDAKCSEMALVNRNLEVNLQTLMQENHLFAEKTRELDSLVMQYRGFENRYTACAAENTELTYLLEKKTLEIGILQSDNFSLQDELKAVRTEFDESRKSAQFLQEKLRGLLSSFDKVDRFLAPESRDFQADDLTGILAKLENLLHNACDKILELVESNKCVVNERDSMKFANVTAESEISSLKKKLEHEIGSLTNKLEALASRFETNGFEEKYMKHHNEHLSGLDSFEVQLQEIASKNAELSRDILALETGTAAELREENQALIASLEAKNEESSRLASELENLKESLESLDNEKQILMAKTEESTRLAEELISLKESLQSLQDEKLALVESLEAKNEESVKLALELESLKESLESLHDEKQTLMAKTEESTQLAEELSSLKESLQSLHSENQALTASLQEKAAEAAKLVLEIDHLKGNSQSMDVEKETLMLSLQEKNELALEIDNLKESLQSLQDEKQALVESLEAKNEESGKLQLERESLKESLESLHGEKQTLVAKTEESNRLAEELNSLKANLQSLQSENQALMLSLQEKDELALEINNLKESLQCLQDEKQGLVESLEAKIEEPGKLQLELESLRESLECLHDEKRTLMACSLVKTEESTQLAEELKGLKESEQSLRNENRYLMACLLEKDVALDSLKGNLRSLDSEKEVLMLSLQEKGELALEINNLKGSLQSLNVKKEALMLSLHEKDEASANLAFEIDNLKESLQSVNVEKEALMLPLQEKDESSSELALEINNLRESLQSMQDENRALAASSQEKINEIDKLQAELNGLRESLQILGDENRALKCLESKMADQASELKEKETQLLHLEPELCEILEVLIATDVRLTFLKSQYESQLAELRKKHIDTETTLNRCVASNECLIEENERLLMSLNSLRSEIEANRNRDLNASQLSEEEIDNLMVANEESEVKILLLKAKLDEKQNQIIAIQGYRDELKRQFNETTQKLAEQTMKAKEFKNLSIHLKDMKDKAEALKPEPEASLRVVFLKEQYETKLQELKQQLSVSKKHGEEILLKLQDTIDEVENLKKSEAIHLKKNEELGGEILDLEAELQVLLADKREITKAYEMMKAEMECCSISLECCKEEKAKLKAELTRVRENLKSSNRAVQNDLFDDERSVNVNEVSASCSSSNGDEIDQNSDHIGENGIRSPVKSKQSDIINNHLRAESLRISMDNLSNELERMKNENSLLQDHELEVKYPNLQSELQQLQKANEELGSMFPSYNEFSGSGNSLERVLALEMELAEALQAKRRSTIHFQSSSDEEAVFKSFRDINDLIKDMLEIKGRYSSVEKELKDMHDRYSQLSLQFAEVEGERQKLMMTLKNVRASKKALQLNRSASASLGDHSV